MTPTFIIDFDSTFVAKEALDELAAIALSHQQDKEKITKEVADITKQGMEGAIDFPTSLARRLSLFTPTKDDINNLIELLKNHITPSISRNKNFFHEFNKYIYIITCGFKEYVFPVVKDFGIASDHVLANTFTYNASGRITGFDKSNPLAQVNGKAKAVKALNLTGKVYIIGDGITDYQVKEQGRADSFFAFTENVYRKGVVAKADKIIKNFDELLFLFDLPRSQSYPVSKMKVLLLENINSNAYDLFTNQGYKVESIKSALSEEELEKKIADVSILGIRSKTEITPKVLSSAKKLMCIGAFCIGTNQIDLTEAARQGIAVFNAPFSNTRSVVELVLSEITVLYRKVLEKNVLMHQGIWDKSSLNSFEIRGKKLGIIGYGNIGSQISVLTESMGMRVYYYDVLDKLALGNTQKCESLSELLKTCDVITVHVDGAKTNKNLIGEKEFAQMKDGAIFINSSRGHVVDVDALVKAIKQGKIAGAAIDVFPNEPKNNIEPFRSPLQGLPNVILTPHISGSTQEAQRNIGEFVSSKLIQYINTGSTVLSVNFPSLSLPGQKDAHRFIHIHDNIPGTLARINSVLAQIGANIEGQFLKTNENIGYVITDINKNYNDDLTKKLTQISGTIKVRVLY